jgi:hypothetical protein
MCPEKKRLMDEVVDALRLMASLHYKEIDCVKEGDFTFDGVKAAAFQKMIEVKDGFKRELQRHVAEHGC